MIRGKTFYSLPLSFFHPLCLYPSMFLLHPPVLLWARGQSPALPSARRNSATEMPSILWCVLALSLSFSIVLNYWLRDFSRIMNPPSDRSFPSVAAIDAASQNCTTFPCSLLLCSLSPRGAHLTITLHQLTCLPGCWLPSAAAECCFMWGRCVS